MPLWDDLGTAGQLANTAAPAPANTAVPATLPSDQEIMGAWNANRQDPAAVYKLMQQNGVSTTQLARVLNMPDVTPGVLAEYLNTGQKQINPGSMINDNGPAIFDYNAKTAPSTETKEQFLASIKPEMLDSDGKFKSPEEGGNYMDTGMTPEHVWEVANMPDNHWFNDETPAHPGALSTGRDTMLDPHWQNGVQDTGGVVGNAWRAIVRPVATIAALMAGGEYLAAPGATTTATTGAALGGSEVGGSAGLGSGTVLGGGAATAPTASGLAGTLGMSPGMGATALNSGALNTGMSLVRGNSLGDSLKNGVIGAVLSPVGTMAGDAAGSALSNSGLGSAAVKGISTVAGNSAMGGAQAVLTGQDVSKGLGNGAVNGIVNAAGNYVGSQATNETGSQFAGTAANALTRGALKGNISAATISDLATQYASGKISDLSGLPPQVATMVVNLSQGKKADPAGALTQYTLNQGAVGSKSLKQSTMGNAVGSGALTQVAGQ